MIKNLMQISGCLHPNLYLSPDTATQVFIFPQIQPLPRVIILWEYIKGILPPLTEVVGPAN